MSQPVTAAVTAEQHIAKGQALLARAEACLDPSPDRAEALGILADTHFHAARAIAAAEQARATRDMRRDMKEVTAGSMDLMRRVMGDGEDL
jgi:hypothetical protein